MLRFSNMNLDVNVASHSHYDPDIIFKKWVSFLKKTKNVLGSHQPF